MSVMLWESFFLLLPIYIVTHREPTGWKQNKWQERGQMPATKWFGICFAYVCVGQMKKQQIVNLKDKDLW